MTQATETSFRICIKEAPLKIHTLKKKQQDPDRCVGNKGVALIIAS